MKALSIIFAIMFLTINLGLMIGQNSRNINYATAEQVIESIIKNTGCSPIPKTVDVIKEGDPQTPVTGIITCMFATMDVLKQAVNKNCNLLIVHEPLYYNHLDDTKALQNDAVYLEKKRFITDHKLVIWRFHDYIHSMKPDGIETGMIAKLGWKEYLVKGTSNQFVLPETTLHDLLKNLKQTFPKNAFYVVGNPDMKLSNVRLAEGAPGSATHIRLLEEKNVDVILAGESPQWETYEYIRDAVDQDRKKAVIFLGHINSEESGMNYCAQWLKTFIKDIPIQFVECGPSFWSY
ncbi:MAG: Nif3-like dinuclear metal center hexameric protein [Bacteroidales bacterium]